MTTRYERLESFDVDVKDAIQVENVKKSYGFGPIKTPVLTGINLNIQRGEIYGLLGPSGCGKTTLVKMITGMLSPDSGSIRVFGCPVGSKEIQIPGVGVGYMPQEIALFGEFTVQETMSYFGHIYNMNGNEVEERSEMLLKLLCIPDKTAFVKNLSGGQKRRVSFAVSLFQNAPLLLLDEPTVGVDPLLRRSIWNHLVTLVQENDVTVIFITHYIDEVRKANKVGLMLDGKILEEDTPQNLLTRYASRSLEDVFLKLCSEKEEKCEEIVTGNAESVSFELRPRIKDSSLKSKRQKRRTRRKSFSDYFISINRTKAVVVKNYTHMKRNFGLLLLQFIVPSLQIAIFYFALGRKPTDLPVGFVNSDDSSLEFGQVFRNVIDKKTLTLQSYDELDVGLEALKEFEVMSLVYIPENFTTNLLTRILTIRNASDEVLQGGKVKIWIDNVDQELLVFLRMEMLLTIKKFVYSLLTSYGLNPSIGELPISFETEDLKFDDATMLGYLTFIAPGIIVVLSHFIPIALTNLVFVIEKRDGLIERIYVAGVTDIEITVGFCVTQGFIMMIQIILSLMCMVFMFGVPCRGPIFWVITLLISLGWSGLFQGLMISALIDDECLAMCLQSAYFLPSCMLTGIVWPFEALPDIMKYVSYCLPITYPVKTLRALLLRGWGISEPVVWRGILIAIGWILVFIFMTVVVLRCRRKM